MISSQEIKKIAKNCINVQYHAILELKNRIDDNFTSIIRFILESKGRLIVVGIGKSANIGRKMVATFNSTGQPSIFLHASEAIHGDLGNIQKEDIVMCVSKSGNTPEIKSVVSVIKKMSNPIIAMTGNTKSYLAQEAEFIIDVSVLKEACSNDLIPTSSTTAQLVMGDALAISLLECNNFTDEDFARFHPGGTLGKRLSSRLSDLINSDNKPIVTSDDLVNSVILEISNKRLGATAVIDNDELKGIITDGDLRRMIEKEEDFSTLRARDIMTKDPIIMNTEDLAYNGLRLMEQNNISQLIILDNDSYVGIVHIHDIIKLGVV
tara:strand:+ start:1566 stop:2531 length:966 start_codon:yes stop_codon:yes gene_type:complete